MRLSRGGSKLCFERVSREEAAGYIAAASLFGRGVVQRSGELRK